MSSTPRHRNGSVQTEERERLSLADCRKHLPPTCTLSDTEVLRVRDQMYTMAEHVVSLAIDQSTPKVICDHAAPRVRRNQ